MTREQPFPTLSRLRGLLVLLVTLLAIEAIAILADRHWSFRTRLLQAFETATRSRESDAQEQWSDPARAFGTGSGAPPPRFRTAGAWNPTGETIDPANLPPGPRVIVLGESAAFGVGCRADETFAALLARAFAPEGIQVLNAGQVGADAWEVLVAGAQLLERFDPSVLVIFTGNNLWIDWAPPQQPRWDPSTIGALRALATSRAIAALEFLTIRWALLHTDRQWRVEQLARLDTLFGADAGRSDPGGAPPEEPFRDHAELRGSRYALAHPLLESPELGAADWAAIKRRDLERFETSLELLIGDARARGVRVVLVSMPFSHRLSPAWKHPQLEAVDPTHRDAVRALLREAGARVQRGECAAALEHLDRALALDPQPPLLHYLRAQCLERLGRADEARAAYAQSREHMIGNLGSRLSVNEVIRAVAAREQVALVDAAALFDAHGIATGDPFGERLILDDCHPSPAGHGLIADALVPLLSAQLDK